MKRIAAGSILMLFALHAVPADAQRTREPSTDGRLNIIAFCAHPDDCDQRAGGIGARLAALGHRVRFVAVTNGDAGHQTEGGGVAARRRLELHDCVLHRQLAFQRD